MVLLFLPLSQLFLGLLLQADPESQTKPQPIIEDVNLVGNFSEDGETKMEVVIRLPNNCYEVKKIDLRFDPERDTLLFFPEVVARKAPSGSCKTESGISTQWVNLGELSEGSYQVRELISLKSWAKFKIAKSSTVDSETIGFYKH